LRMLHSAPLPAPVRSRVKAAARGVSAGRATSVRGRSTFVAGRGRFGSGRRGFSRTTRPGQAVTGSPPRSLARAAMGAVSGSSPREPGAWRWRASRERQRSPICCEREIPTEIFRASFSADQADVVEQAIE
jgi:hypothetical protein